MEVFRLARKKYPLKLSGKGASQFGARWNSKGTEVIYVAQSRALAMAEVVVHLSLAMLPKDFVMLTITIPDTVSITVLDEKKLQRGWSIFPNSFTTQILGDTFIKEGEYCILKVPSAVVKGDFNYIINPNHADFKQIKITYKEDFPFDKRIFKS
jgi:RES domain-containing protein